MAGPGRAASDGWERALLPRGALASAAIAVRVAWARRRPLFVVVALALSPALAVDAAAQVRASGADAAIVNDELVHPLSGAVPNILVFPVLVFLAWCVALGAAVVVAGGGLLGVEPAAGGALRLAVRALPTTMFLPVFMTFGFFWSLVSGAALWVILAAASTLLLVYAIGGEDSWVFLALAAALAFAGVVVPLARALARWALVVPVAVLNGPLGPAAFGRARELIRQDEPVTGEERPDATEPASTVTPPGPPADDRARMLLVPGLLMLLGVFVWVGESRERPGGAWSSGFVDATLVVIVMLQAATLALAYLRRRGDGDETRAVDLDAVRARLPAPAGRFRWGWLAVALVLLPLPTTVAETTVAVNPYGVPRWTLHESNLDGGIRAAAWPAGQHPIVVTDFHVVDCLDDGCDRQARWGSTAVPGSAVTVSADGTVVMAGVSRPEGGRDTVRLARCTRAGDCTRAEVAWPTDPARGQPLVAAAATKSGALVASARRGSGPRVELALTRCAEWTCANPVVTDLGTVTEPAPAGGERRTPYGRGPLDVRQRPDGTAQVTYRGHHGRAAVPVVCAPRCAPAGPAAGDALALSADSAYALLADVGPEPDEVFGAFGAATPRPVQLVVARCARPGCDAVDRRWRLNTIDRPGAALDGLLVVTPGGRALVVQATDRMSVATAILPA